MEVEGEEEEDEDDEDDDEGDEDDDDEEDEDEDDEGEHPFGDQFQELEDAIYRLPLDTGDDDMDLMIHYQDEPGLHNHMDAHERMRAIQVKLLEKVGIILKLPGKFAKIATHKFLDLIFKLQF